MLLCFSLGDERFALDTTMVKKVVPLVQLKKIPNSPAWVAGVMRYHGQIVPVIDLCALNLQRPAERRMSTRIILTDFVAHNGSNQMLGLLAEKVTEILQQNPDEFADTGIKTPLAPWLGGVSSNGENMIQLVTVAKLLTAEVQDLLFQKEEMDG